jgi:hypothetical protein
MTSSMKNTLSFLDSDIKTSRSSRDFSTGKIRDLSDSELLRATREIAREEQRSSLLLIEHLLEVDARKLYATLKHDSLFKYVVKTLGYSETTANERIRAMRLVRAVPEAREKLSDGTLTLTAAAKVESFRRQEKLDDGRALEVVRDASEQRNLNELDRLLLSQAENPVIPKERIRQVTPELKEAKLILTPEHQALIQRYEELHGKAPLSQILLTVLEAHLKKKDPLQREDSRKQARSGSTAPILEERAIPGVSNSVKEESLTPRTSANREQQQSMPRGLTATSKRCVRFKHRSRYIEANVRRTLWSRSQGQCEWYHPITGERCLSRFRLEFDHYPTPFAKGGPSTEENLRHVCRAHNARHSVEVYGVRRVAMRSFTSGTSGTMRDVFLSLRRETDRHLDGLIFRAHGAVFHANDERGLVD